MTKISRLISKSEELEREIALEEKTMLNNAIQELQIKLESEDPSVIDIQNKIIAYKSFELIDKYNIDGDFVESQAFAFLAIRSILKLPISFPETTGCKKPCTGGVIVKNF